MTDESPGRDEQAVSRFVERFAAVLVDSGWPRMAARVFVTVLASESAGLTAGEVGEALQVSPAGVSGAVRYLAQLDLISREREPGSRRDVYRVDPDVWYSVVDRGLRSMMKWDAQLHDGLLAVGEDSVAAERLTEMGRFFEFMRGEVPAMMKRWHDTRRPAGRG